MMKIDSEKNKATIETVGSELGENATEANIETTGPAQEVIFNARYFLDGINSISSSKIAIFINNATSPVALKEVSEKNGEVLDEFLYIVMPVKN
jgi:DNA polymerase III sliding clamp (beta) subunit (PCNA family)